MVKVLIYWNAHQKIWVLAIDDKTFHVARVEIHTPVFTVIDQFKGRGQGEAYLETEGFPVIEEWESGLDKVVILTHLPDNGKLLR